MICGSNFSHRYTHTHTSTLTRKHTHTHSHGKLQKVMHCCHTSSSSSASFPALLYFCGFCSASWAAAQPSPAALLSLLSLNCPPLWITSKPKASCPFAGETMQQVKCHRKPHAAPTIATAPARLQLCLPPSLPTHIVLSFPLAHRLPQLLLLFGLPVSWSFYVCCAKTKQSSLGSTFSTAWKFIHTKQVDLPAFPLPRSPLHICLSGRLSDICLFIYLSCRHNTRNSLLRCCCCCFRQQWQPKVLQPAVKSSAFLIEAHTHTHTHVKNIISIVSWLRIASLMPAHSTSDHSVCLVNPRPPFLLLHCLLLEIN